MQMFSEHLDEVLDGLQAAFECARAPLFNKALCSPAGAILPEVFKLVFQDPGAMDFAIARAQGVEDAGVLFGSILRVLEKQPAKALEDFAFIGGRLAPLFFADLIDGGVEGLNDVEAVQDQGGLGAVRFNGSNVGLTHIAAGPLDFRFLVVTERFIEELVDGFATLSLADPYDAGAIQVIDDGGILVAPAVGDLIDAHGFKVPNAVSFPQPSNAAVQLIREGGGSHLQKPGSNLLGHELAIDEHRILEAIGDPGIGLGPRDRLLDAAMLAA